MRTFSETNAHRIPRFVLWQSRRTLLDSMQILSAVALKTRARFFRVSLHSPKHRLLLATTQSADRITRNLLLASRFKHRVETLVPEVMIKSTLSWAKARQRWLERRIGPSLARRLQKLTLDDSKQVLLGSFP